MLAAGIADRSLKMNQLAELPGGPVVKTPCFHCRGHRFNPWSGNYDPACPKARPKKRKKK